MTINVLRKMKYRDTFIYVFQMDYTFMYLFSLNNEIYQNRIELVPPVWKRILYRLGLMKTLYTKEQTEEGGKIVLSGAVESLDKLSDPKLKAEHRKAKKALKRKFKEAKDSNECIWQAQEGLQEGQSIMHYVCLTHKEIVKMEDGVQPKHK